jgi:hypothetical protein
LLASPSKGGYVTSTQVLGEFFNAVTRKLDYSDDLVGEAVRRFAPLATIPIDRAWCSPQLSSARGVTVINPFSDLQSGSPS